MATKKKKVKKKSARKKVVKRKTAKKVVLLSSKQGAKAVVTCLVPPALEHIWCEDIKNCWVKLEDKHKLFIITWMEVSYNGTKAYKQVYGDNNITNDAARASAARLLAHVNVKPIREAIVANPNWNEERQHDVFIEAMDDDNAYVRMEAVKNIKSLQKGAMGQQPAGTTINIQNNIIVTDSVDSLKHLFNNKE